MKATKYLSYLILLMFALPAVFADTQSFTMQSNTSTQINISAGNQTFNISTEQGVFSYSEINGSFNITDSKIINISRNVTCSYNLTQPDVSNISSLYFVLQNISDSASIIAKAGADSSAYFNLYTTCLANLTASQTNLSILGSQQNFQSQFQQCNAEKTGLQGQVNSLTSQLGNVPSAGVPGVGCKNDLQNCIDSQSGVHNYYIGLFVLGLIGGAFLMYYFKVKPKTGSDSYQQQPQRYD